MPQELQQLQQALVQADAAGDVEAATKLADTIRRRRATGGSVGGASPTPAPTPPDPLDTVPVEIDGVQLDDDMRQRIFDVRSLEDPKEQRLEMARIAGRLAQQDKSGNMIDRFAQGEFGAGLRGFTTGLLGVGDYAAAAGTALQGIGDEKAMSFGEALEAQREFRHALEEEHPLSSIAGEIAGAVGVGGGALAAVKGAKNAGKAGQVLNKVLSLQPGQKIANVARASAAGATSGGITEGLSENEAAEGAVIGAVGGPLGLGVAKAAQIGTKAVKAALADPAAAGMTALAKSLGESPDELMRRFLQFEAVTGKKPSIAEITNPQAVAELNDMISASTGATAVAREQAERLARSRGADIADQVTGGRITTTKTGQNATRDALGKDMFAKADNDPITFSQQQVENLLEDPVFKEGLPRTLQRRLNEIIDNAAGGQTTLTGLDVNDMRIALRKRAGSKAGADRVFSEFADELEDIARGQSKAFGDAIDEFAGRSSRGRGVDAGRKVLNQPTSEFEEVVKQGESTNFKAGQRVGARSAIADTARESSGRANALMRSLAEDSGLVKRLRTVLKGPEVDRLQELGRLQARGAENVEKLAPGVTVQDELQSAVSDAINATVLASTGTSAASKVFAFGRLLKNLKLGLGDKALESLAKDAFDPNKTLDVVQALRRANVAEEKLLDIFSAAATTTGQTGASIANR